jgi:CheY-like chemotaxis protein
LFRLFQNIQSGFIQKDEAAFTILPDASGWRLDKLTVGIEKIIGRELVYLKMSREKKRKTRALVVSLPGMLQNMLRQTLADRTDVDLVGVASGCLSAFSMIKLQTPDLVVIDSNLPDVEKKELILRVHDEKINSRFLVLTETTHQIAQAASAGADFVLRSDTLNKELDSVLNETLNDKLNAIK